VSHFGKIEGAEDEFGQMEGLEGQLVVQRVYKVILLRKSVKRVMTVR
jgi:hypothetical protein